LVSNPQIIMLDEPFAGIDPVTVQSIQVVIKELSQQGIAILITDHAAREILQVTDRTYVVSAGQILCSGSAEEIVQHPEVKTKYLGDIELPGASNGLAASNAAAESQKTSTTAPPHRSPDAPKIIFSKPRSRKTNKVVAPFRSTDLD